MYANAKSILQKGTANLQELRALGVDRLYMGLESGDDQTLNSLVKWGDSAKMIEAANMVKEAAIFLSVTVLLGVAGKVRSLSHAKETARVLNLCRPNQIAALTLMLIPGTPLDDQEKAGRFVMASPFEILLELRCLVDRIKVKRCQFQANHASNYLPINCRLPRDREKVLADIDQALAGEKNLMPDYMRGL